MSSDQTKRNILEGKKLVSDEDSYNTTKCASAVKYSQLFF